MDSKTSQTIDIRGNGPSHSLWRDRNLWTIQCNIPLGTRYDAISLIDNQPIHWMISNDFKTSKPIYCTSNIEPRLKSLGFQVAAVYPTMARMSSGLYAAEYFALEGVKTINLWGFDSIFSNCLTSVMDQWIPRHTRPNLNQWWHPHWSRICQQYPNTDFIVHAPPGARPLVQAPNLHIQHQNPRID